MSGDHVTLRIPKKFIFSLVALLIPAAFVGGLAIGGGNSTSSPDTVPATTLAPEETSTTSSVPTSVAAKKITTTTTATKKKKSTPVATTTTTTLAPKLGITGSYEDNCPEPNVAVPNAGRVAGNITIKWQSTAAVKVTLRVFHGADKLYDAPVNDLVGQMSFARTCNNQKLADGSFNGKPLVVTYLLSAYDAADVLASTNGSGQF